jgi:hypothetical protein
MSKALSHLGGEADQMARQGFIEQDASENQVSADAPRPSASKGPFV